MNLTKKQKDKINDLLFASNGHCGAADQIIEFFNQMISTNNSDYIKILKQIYSVAYKPGAATTKVLKIKDILCRLN